MKVFCIMIMLIFTLRQVCSYKVRKESYKYILPNFWAFLMRFWRYLQHCIFDSTLSNVDVSVKFDTFKKVEFVLWVWGCKMSDRYSAIPQHLQIKSSNMNDSSIYEVMFPWLMKISFFILQVAIRAHEMLFQLSALLYIFPSPCWAH